MKLCERKADVWYSSLFRSRMCSKLLSELDRVGVAIDGRAERLRSRDL
jgi:hypothetical protein